MARRHRRDQEGAWHHVMNRAIARRSLFETRDDIRFFLAGVAREVRRGALEVHAWCVLTTHFHMLVRSPKAELSNAMRRIQNAYARYFNRRRRRDGPLHRGRFTSKPVESVTYRKVLVRYIYGNAVGAGLCNSACDYEWSSARQYARNRGPRWLCREWVESWVMDRCGTTIYQGNSYRCLLDDASQQWLSAVVEARTAAKAGSDNLDSLLAMAPAATKAWLQQKAMLADGTRLELCYVPAIAVNDAIAAQAARCGPWRLARNRQTTDAWRNLQAGLLRDLVGESFVAIGARLQVSGVQAKRLATRHNLLIQEDADYGELAATITHQLLQDAYSRCHQLSANSA